MTKKSLQTSNRQVLTVTDRKQTGKTESKTLITDLDSGTHTNNPNKPESFKVQIVNKNK